jgi:glycosyltransferase involved in cell wall biosynthesis
LPLLLHFTRDVKNFKFETYNCYSKQKSLLVPDGKIATSIQNDPQTPLSIVLLTIIIKALNEERHIERSIESAIAASAEVEGQCEIILADSLSSDNTVQLAKRYPIRILQLQNAKDRSCGAGGQLGWQAAKGAFVYILDGDMELQCGFLPKAIDLLRQHFALAGVAGLVQEMVLTNHAFRNRASKGDTSTPAREPVCLSMGGLYRAEAIRQQGYFTNRALDSFEEFELGIRLIAAGWSMTRVSTPAIRHFGPECTSVSLMMRRWRSGYSRGNGQLLRQCFGKPYFGMAIRKLRIYRVQGMTIALWIVALSAPVLLGTSVLQTTALTVGSWVAVLGLLTIRRRSFGAAIYSIIVWHVGIAGLIRGVLTRPVAQPTDSIASRVIQ